jgi:hypothetical protein
MRLSAVAALVAVATTPLLTASGALAAPAKAALKPDPSAPETALDDLILDSGRIPVDPPNPDTLRMTVHGEYQLRYHVAKDLPLQPPVTGAVRPAALGQQQYVYHWLRLTPRIEFRDKLALVGQIDIPRGLVVGDTTQFVGADRDPLDEQRWYGVSPRYLYLEWNSPIGMFRVGQQGSYWGMGLVANDGDHPSMFGDYRGGSLTERVLFATTPMGKNTPLVLAIAGDLVFRDNTASLLDDDRAFQGVLAAAWRTKSWELGVYGVVRHQARDSVATTPDLTPFTESLLVGVVDVSAKFNAPIPSADAVVYGSLEVATIVGSTDMVRGAYANALDPTAPREDERIRSYGGAAVLGAVRHTGRGAERYGNLVGEIEYGYASGDANPYDGTTKRFTFDPNHRVGLVLFDHVMRWATARASTIAGEKSLVARPAPGLQLLPSNGGIFGASYLNPRFIFRPRSFLDLKGGVVVAQTTADFVDPFHAGALGNFSNYRGGRSRSHDLGIELDVGIEGRIHVDRTVTIQLGAEAGVLLPGHAFDDAAGNSLNNQVLANLKLGLQF